MTLVSEKSLVVAIVCGDGFITESGNLCMHHAIDQKEYLDYKKVILMAEGFNFLKDTQSLGKQRTVRVTAGASQRGKALRSLLYATGKKVLPSGIFSNWGWLEVAILFQDGGRSNKISHYNTKKNGAVVRVECLPFTHRYEFCKPLWSKEICAEFISLLNRLGVPKSRIGGQHQIVISEGKSKIALYEGLKPHMIPCMRYKLVRPTLSYCL